MEVSLRVNDGSRLRDRELDDVIKFMQKFVLLKRKTESTKNEKEKTKIFLYLNKHFIMVFTQIFQDLRK
jgi:hypothetical protein